MYSYILDSLYFFPSFPYKNDLRISAQKSEKKMNIIVTLLIKGQ